MPKLLANEEEMEGDGVGNFKFSTVAVENLDEMEYTLVSLEVDTSSSVWDFADDLLEAIKSSVRSLKQSSKAENILLRVNTFNSEGGSMEIHGFRELNTINEDDYDPLSCGGMTALRDAFYDSIGAISKLGTKMSFEKDQTVNGLVVAITDGCENDSGQTLNDWNKLITALKKNEELESVTTILVGINATSALPELQKFQTEHSIDEFVDCGDDVAKVGKLISKSVSSTSKSLGSGSAPVSQSLTF